MQHTYTGFWYSYLIKEYKQVGVPNKIDTRPSKAMKHGFQYEECNMITAIKVTNHLGIYRIKYDGECLCMRVEDHESTI